MANIEVVIKIPEEEYEYLKSGHAKEVFYGDTIVNGTLLPKGHGRLIDASKLKTRFIGTEQGTDLEVYLEPTIINAPTIIPATKECDVESEDDDK